MTTALRSSVLIPMVDLPARAGASRKLGVLEALGPAARITLPLAGVELKARVADRVAEVSVSQKFHNTLTEPLEAVYIFPLAGGAAVSRFELQIGARVLRGKVEERGEARRQYSVALEDGKRAALLEQERDDVFTVQVGNLMPGEEVTVRLTYSERLPFFEDGRTELRLPLVVAPRFVGGVPVERDQVGRGVGEDSTTVPDASRITPPRLVPGFDPKTALSIECELVSGFADLACSQHATQLSADAQSVKVQLSRTDEPLDRDFVLRWKLAGEQVKSTLLVHDGYALLSLVPPTREGFLGTPRDVVFVVDRSGSMEGVKMASAARACALLLRTLSPSDRFAIQAFDNTAEWMPGPRFVFADEGAIEAGERFLRDIQARGGTELDVAMTAALAAIDAVSALEATDAEEPGTESGGRVPIIVLLTDGQVGDESSVLRRIQTQLGEARVFTIGIDTAVNSGFLKRLAALGGGTSTLVEPGAQLESALQAVGREIGTPLITDLVFEGEGIEPGSLAPARIPDLFAGRASAVFLKLRKAGKVRVRGTYSDGKKFEARLEPQDAPGLGALAHLWARARVTDLEDRFRAGPGEQTAVRAEIVALAIQHTLLTRFTAFVVVDESEVVNRTGARREVVQPVEQPARWAPQGAPLAAQASFAGAGGLTRSSAPVLAAPSPVNARAPSGAGPKLEASLPAPQRSSKKGSIAKVARSVMADVSQLLGVGAAASFQASPGSLGSQVAPGSIKTEVEQPDWVPPEERAPVEKALEALVNAVAEARQKLAAGQLPTPAALEKARKELLSALKASALATQLPALQRFLRQGAVELVAALKAKGATAAQLSPLFEKQARALEAARDEARGPLQGHAKPAAPAAFWEASI